MKYALSTFVLSLICLPVMAQVSVPKIGTLRYPDGSLHSVQGVDANMIVAELPLEPADAASFSDQGGLLAQKGVIHLLASDFSALAEYPTSETPLLAMDGGLTSAFAWLPAAQTLVHWNGSSFDSLRLGGSELEGKVTDIQSSGPKQARLIVEHGDGSVSAVSVSLRTGNLVSSEQLPGVRGYAYGQGFLVVYASQTELVADNFRGYRRGVPLPAPDLTIERMSNNWLHLYSPSLQQNWALHVTQSNLQLSLLPGLPERRAPSAIEVSASRGIK